MRDHAAIRSFGKPAHVGSAGLRIPQRMSSPRPEPGLACRATDQACTITAIRMAWVSGSGYVERTPLAYQGPIVP